jgi:hypothetical protein
MSKLLDLSIFVASCFRGDIELATITTPNDGHLPPKLFLGGPQWSIRHSNQSALRVVHL